MSGLLVPNKDHVEQMGLGSDGELVAGEGIAQDSLFRHQPALSNVQVRATHSFGLCLTSELCLTSAVTDWTSNSQTPREGDFGSD